MIYANKILATSASLFVLSSLVVTAQDTAKIQFRLLPNDFTTGFAVISFLFVLAIMILAIKVSRSSTYAQDAFFYLVLSTIFLLLLSLNQLLRTLKLADIAGLGMILIVLFYVTLLQALFKFKQ